MKALTAWTALAVFLQGNLLSSRAADTQPPQMTNLLQGAGSGFTQLAVAFSEPVTGVDAEDLLIDGQGALTLSGSGANYVFGFNEPSAGLVEVFWDDDHEITDLAGNPFDSAAAGSFQFFVADSVPPSVAVLSPAVGARVSSLGEVSVLFSEPVSGVGSADLLVNGAAATNVTGQGAGPYVFRFTTPPPGLVQVAWAGTQAIRDAATNRLIGGGWVYTLDPARPADVVINEFLTAETGAGGYLDEDGQASDWIELLNRGNTTVNLAGWSLTDDPTQPGQWVFPAVSINPGQYLVVFASGKDRTSAAAGSRLHTSFQLNPAGEYLGLYDADFPPHAVHAVTPAFPEQRNDTSFGLGPSGQWEYFNPPTPGGANGANGLQGVVAPVHFSVERGFFAQPFTLVMTTPTPGAQIRYTLDGSEPSAMGGSVYAQPLAIGKTTVVRAAAFASGMVPSTVGTESYLFLADVIQQPVRPDGYPLTWSGVAADYEMDPRVVTNPAYADTIQSDLMSVPTLSVVCDPADLFGPNGIYINAEAHGPAWERAASAEFIYPDGSRREQVNAGFQIQGGTSRSTSKAAKHSFRLVFKGDYGPSKLAMHLFPDSPVDRFDTLVLDAGLNLTWIHPSASQQIPAQYVRDQYVSDLQNLMGGLAPHGKFFHLYLNGLYWGMYGVHERPDESFAASYLGGDKEDYDVLKDTTSFEVVNGNQAAWNAMMSLVNSGLADNAQYEQLAEYLDMTAFCDYMIANLYTGNTDWPFHNWYAIRKRVPGAKFYFVSWDAEHVLKSPNEDRSRVSDGNSPGAIYDQLRRNNGEFRLLFADRLQKHFFNGGPLCTDPAQPAWNPDMPERNRPAYYYMQRINEIDRAIVGESARWGDNRRPSQPYTRDGEWEAQLLYLLHSYFPSRSATVLNQFRNAGLWPTVDAPVFNPFGGRVPQGFALTMTAPAGTIYYTTNGADPRVYGSGAVASAARIYSGPVPLNRSAVVKARVLNGSEWSALTEAPFQSEALGVPLRITELMYNPTPGGSAGEPYEYLELENSGAVTLDLSGYSFEGVNFSFTAGTMLAPGAIVVLASDANPAAFAARYPGVLVAGYFGGSLANGGERVALLDASGETVLSVDYNDAGGWPEAADGAGSSLEMVDVTGDPDDPANWRASVANGTPGVAATVRNAAVLLNEIMAENAGAVDHEGTFPDWVELYNPGTNVVDLAGWSLSDDGDPRRFVFPDGESIAAGGYRVIWCDAATNATSGLHSDFGLKREGESLFLYNSATQRMDAVSFGPQVGGASVGRIEGRWALNEPTPGAANSGRSVAAATNLVVNEWLANPLPGGNDWLELFNRSATEPLNLQGFYLGTSHALFHYQALSFIPPLDHLQLVADEKPGPDHVDFKLPASGGAIFAADPSGQEIDRITYSAQAENVTEGRLPDGTAAVAVFPGSASPGASNYVAMYSGPRLNEILARNRSAVGGPHGDYPDFVELFNAGSTAFDLSGLGLGKGSGVLDQFALPAGTMIGPGDWLVIWCDGNEPPTTVAGTLLNSGFSLSGSSGRLSLLDSAGRVLDSVQYRNTGGRSSYRRRWRPMDDPGRADPGRRECGARGNGRRRRIALQRMDGGSVAGRRLAGGLQYRSAPRGVGGAVSFG